MDSSDSRPSSPEENLALPEYAQSLLPEVEFPRLVLISHGSSPPLNPASHLRFDVRSLPNPPKHIRDAYNGTSKRLQEWMQTDGRFIARRDEIKFEIEQALTTMTTTHEQKDILKLDTQRDEEHGSRSVGMSEEVEAEGKNNDGSGNDEEESTSSQESFHDDAVSSRDGATTLRVGIFCAMGRHRSVAMVEELAKLSWPGWRVEVEHRDISKKRGAGKKSGGKGSRGSRGGTIPTQFDDQSE
jgi:RNase adaptor protein for sRNA GlmZ degradation